MTAARIDLTGLVELSAGNANVLILCRECSHYHLTLSNGYPIYTAKRRQKRDNYSGRRRKPANRKAPLYNTRNTVAKRKSVIQRNRRAAQIIRPVILLCLRHGIHMSLRAALKLRARKLNDTVLLYTVRNAYACIDSHSRHLAKLVVAMRAYRANTVRAESHAQRLSFINF